MRPRSRRDPALVLRASRCSDPCSARATGRLDLLVDDAKAAGCGRAGRQPRGLSVGGQIRRRLDVTVRVDRGDGLTTAFGLVEVIRGGNVGRLEADAARNTVFDDRVGNEIGPSPRHAAHLIGARGLAADALCGAGAGHGVVAHRGRIERLHRVLRIARRRHSRRDERAASAARAGRRGHQCEKCDESKEALVLHSVSENDEVVSGFGRSCRGT